MRVLFSKFKYIKIIFIVIVKDIFLCWLILGDGAQYGGEQ